MEQQAEGSKRRSRLTEDERIELDRQIEEEEERMRQEMFSPTFKRLTEKQRRLHKIMSTRKHRAQQKAIGAEKKVQERKASRQDEERNAEIAFMQNVTQMVYRIAPEEKPAEDGDDGQNIEEGHGGKEAQETEKRDCSSMDIGFVLN